MAASECSIGSDRHGGEHGRCLGPSVVSSEQVLLEV